MGQTSYKPMPWDDPSWGYPDEKTTETRPWNKAEVKKALAKALRKEPNEGIWRSLVKEDYVAMVISGDADMAYVVKRYRTVERSFQEYLRDSRPSRARDGAPATRKEAPSSKRDILIAKVMAKEAGEVPRVRRFRREHLSDEDHPSGLLAREDIESWIEARVADEGDDWIEPLVSDWNALRAAEHLKCRELAELASIVLPLHPFAIHRLRWLSPKGKGECPVKPGGVLDELRIVSQDIAYMLQVGAENATHLILTGSLYPETPVQATWHPRGYLGPEGWRDRCTITITVTGNATRDEVLEAYSRAREQLTDRSDTRIRGLGERSETLVEFVLDSWQGTWLDTMKRFNETYPRYHFETSWSFAGHCRDAVNRLFDSGADRIKIVFFADLEAPPYLL